ncbi:hypothetical protein R69746_08684 [Paraburkholderia aspalathi]|nr:hypothetical protein R69746_08684 [Paraburkholderia aspalathi]
MAPVFVDLRDHPVEIEVICLLPDGLDRAERALERATERIYLPQVAYVFADGRIEQIHLGRRNVVNGHPRILKERRLHLSVAIPRRHIADVIQRNFPFYRLQQIRQRSLASPEHDVINARVCGDLLVKWRRDNPAQDDLRGGINFLDEICNLQSEWQVRRHWRQQIDVTRGGADDAFQTMSVDTGHRAFRCVQIQRLHRPVTCVDQYASKPGHPVRQLPEDVLHVPQTGMGRVVADVEIPPEILSLSHGDGRHRRVDKYDVGHAAISLGPYFGSPTVLVECMIHAYNLPCQFKSLPIVRQGESGARSFF